MTNPMTNPMTMKRFSPVIKYAVLTGIALLVFILAGHGLDNITWDIKFEVSAKTPGAAVWKLGYNIAPGKHIKRNRTRWLRLAVEPSSDLQTKTFPFSFHRRLDVIYFDTEPPSTHTEVKHFSITAIGGKFYWQPRQGVTGARLEGADFTAAYESVRSNGTRTLIFNAIALLIALLAFLLLHRRIRPDIFVSKHAAGKKGDRQEKSLAVVISVVLISALTLFLFVYTITGGGASLDNTEKRKLAPKPQFELARAWEFPAEYRRYFNDHFALRRLMIRWSNLLKVKFFKISPVPKVIIGKEGWLFYRSELAGDGNTIEDYQGRALFTPAQLETIRKNIRYKAQWCRKRGIYFLVVLIPNKETVYSQHLPGYIRKGKQTRLEQLREYFKTGPLLPVLDITEELMERARMQQLYYKGGTHWNQYGAYYGYRAIMKRIAQQFPELEPFPLTAFQEEIVENSSFDHWFGFNEHHHVNLTLRKPFLRRSKEQGSVKKAIAFRDSFLKDFPHFFQYHFSPFHQESNRSFNHALIRQEEPDIVIWEIIERASDILLKLK